MMLLIPKTVLSSKGHTHFVRQCQLALLVMSPHRFRLALYVTNSGLETLRFICFKSHTVPLSRGIPTGSGVTSNHCPAAASPAF
jgi:hypothetical protein